MVEFAAMVGSRRIEVLRLTLPQIDSEANTIRLMRVQQHRLDHERASANS